MEDQKIEMNQIGIKRNRKFDIKTGRYVDQSHLFNKTPSPHLDAKQITIKSSEISLFEYERKITFSEKPLLDYKHLTIHPNLNILSQANFNAELDCGTGILSVELDLKLELRVRIASGEFSHPRIGKLKYTVDAASVSAIITSGISTERGLNAEILGEIGITGPRADINIEPPKIRMLFITFQGGLDLSAGFGAKVAYGGGLTFDKTKPQVRVYVQGGLFAGMGGIIKPYFDIEVDHEALARANDIQLQAIEEGRKSPLYARAFQSIDNAKKAAQGNTLKLAELNQLEAEITSLASLSLPELLVKTFFPSSDEPSPITDRFRSETRNLSFLPPKPSSNSDQSSHQKFFKQMTEESKQGNGVAIDVDPKISFNAFFDQLKLSEQVISQFNQEDEARKPWQYHDGKLVGTYPLSSNFNACVQLEPSMLIYGALKLRDTVRWALMERGQKVRILITQNISEIIGAHKQSFVATLPHSLMTDYATLESCGLGTLKKHLRELESIGFKSHEEMMRCKMYYFIANQRDTPTLMALQTENGKLTHKVFQTYHSSMQIMLDEFQREYSKKNTSASIKIANDLRKSFPFEATTFLVAAQAYAANGKMDEASKNIHDGLKKLENEKIFVQSSDLNFESKLQYTESLKTLNADFLKTQFLIHSASKGTESKIKLLECANEIHQLEKSSDSIRIHAYALAKNQQYDQAVKKMELLTGNGIADKKDVEFLCALRNLTGEIQPTLSNHTAHSSSSAANTDHELNDHYRSACRYIQKNNPILALYHINKCLSSQGCDTSDRQRLEVMHADVKSQFATDIVVRVLSTAISELISVLVTKSSNQSPRPAQNTLTRAEIEGLTRHRFTYMPVPRSKILDYGAGNGYKPSEASLNIAAPSIDQPQQRPDAIAENFGHAQNIFSGYTQLKKLF